MVCTDLNPVLIIRGRQVCIGFRISNINCGFWFPSDLYTICWNFYNQSLISWTLLFCLKLLDWNCDRFHGRLFVWSGSWLFRTGRMQQSCLGKPIHILLLLIHIHSFLLSGTRITPHKNKSWFRSSQSKWVSRKKIPLGCGSTKIVVPL